MRCPSCGANVDTAYCEYCGSKMPVEQVETQTIQGDKVVVNNYYYQVGDQGTAPGGTKGSIPGNDQQAAWQQAAQRAAWPQNAQQAAWQPAVNPNASSKSRLIALLLCFFVGMFGGHRFYTGRYALGALYLLTLGLFGIGYLVDLVLILLGKMKDGDGRFVENWS